MATEVYKVLGQSAPAAATLTTIYTVPATTEAIVSTLAVCNRSATPTTFRIAVQVAGAASADKQWIAYDVAIGANEMFRDTLGFGLATTDVVSVYNTLATLSFTVGGMEIT